MAEDVCSIHNCPIEVEWITVEIPPTDALGGYAERFCPECRRQESLRRREKWERLQEQIGQEVLVTVTTEGFSVLPGQPVIDLHEVIECRGILKAVGFLFSSIILSPGGIIYVYTESTEHAGNVPVGRVVGKITEIRCGGEIFYRA